MRTKRPAALFGKAQVPVSALHAAPSRCAASGATHCASGACFFIRAGRSTWPSGNGAPISGTGASGKSETGDDGQSAGDPADGQGSGSGGDHQLDEVATTSWPSLKKHLALGWRSDGHGAGVVGG